MSMPKCRGERCPVDKTTCRKFNALPNPVRQIWVRFNDDKKGGCREYLQDFKKGVKR